MLYALLEEKAITDVGKLFNFLVIIVNILNSLFYKIIFLYCFRPFFYHDFVYSKATEIHCKIAVFGSCIHLFVVNRQHLHSEMSNLAE